MFAQAKASLIKLIGTQRTALNLGIRFFANYLLFALYPKYLVLVYLGTSGFFSYDLFSAGETGIHASLWFSLLIAALFAFYVLMPVLLWSWWRTEARVLAEAAPSLDESTRKAKSAEVRQAGLFFFLVAVCCCFVLVFSLKLVLWKFLLFILAFLLVFVVATVIAVKLDTLRYIGWLSILYGGLLVLPLMATTQTSLFVALGLNRFGLAGGPPITVFLDHERTNARAVTGTLMLLSPENIFLVETGTGRRLIVRRSDSGLIAYAPEPKPAAEAKETVPPPAPAASAAPAEFHWSDLLSPKEIIYAAIGILGGAVLGITFTLLYERRRARVNARRLIKAIKVSLQFSYDRAEQARNMLEKGGMPSFPLDSARLTGLLSQAIGIIPDATLRGLDWHRFQLDHASGSLSMLSGDYVSRQTRGEAVETPYDKMMREMLGRHLGIIIEGTPKHLAALDALD